MRTYKVTTTKGTYYTVGYASVEAATKDLKSRKDINGALLNIVETKR